MEGKMSYDNAWTIQGYKVVWQAYACINDVSPTRPARITRYRSTQKAVPVRWMLCLPDCVLPSAVFRTRQHSDAGNIWYSSSLAAGNGGANAYYIFYTAWTIQGYIVVCQAYARINAVSPTRARKNHQVQKYSKSGSCSLNAMFARLRAAFCSVPHIDSIAMPATFDTVAA